MNFGDAPLTSEEAAALAVGKLLSNDGHSVKVDRKVTPLALVEDGRNVYRCSCGRTFPYLTSLRLHEIMNGHDTVTS